LIFLDSSDRIPLLENKERWSKMTTLTMCKKHTPNLSAISEVNEKQFTFCENCENNISRFWVVFGGDRLDDWSSWKID
jgi:RNA polymerase-binding transcription factor DksA